MISPSSGFSPPLLCLTDLSFDQQSARDLQTRHDPSDELKSDDGSFRHSFQHAEMISSRCNAAHESPNSIPDLDLEFLQGLESPSLEDRNWLDSLTPVSTPLTVELAAQELTGRDTSASTTASNSTKAKIRASSPKGAQKQRKDHGNNIPFNFKVSSKDEAINDGYTWKKYGKKTIKSSSHPRYYYKCASRHCNARKQVRHSPADASVIFTTYEGTHNHEPSIAFGVVVSPTVPCFCFSSHGSPCLNLARASLHNPHPSFSHEEHNELHQSNPHGGV